VPDDELLEEEDEREFQPGMKVEFRDMASKPEMNGTQGTLK